MFPHVSTSPVVIAASIHIISHSCASFLTWNHTQEEAAEDAEKDDDGEDVSEVVEAVAAAETDVFLQKQIWEQSEQLETLKVRPAVQEAEAEMGSEDEGHLEPVEKQSKKDCSIRTLHDVLIASSLHHFHSPENDDEEQLLLRLRKLFGPMQSFSAFVHVHEKILSRASIEGRTRDYARDHCKYEHELAQARAQYHCSAQRQSRHQLWYDYSERLATALDAETDGQPAKAKGAQARALTEVVNLIPNSQKQEGSRTCQLLVVRPFKAGGQAGAIRFAVVTSVWRGGKSAKKRAKDHVWPSGALPLSAATRLHVRLVMPAGDQQDDGSELCVASSLSPVVPLDPHDGSVMMEVSSEFFTYQYDEMYLRIWLRKQVVKELVKLSKAAVPFSLKAADQKDGMHKTYYSEEDFSRNSTGLKNIQRYMLQMLRDYEEHVKPLIQPNGEIALRSDIKTTWPELMSRVSSYFKKYVKGSAHFKTMTEESQKIG